MALVEQSFPINFANGINTKVDPWQIPFGEFSSLENIVFNRDGLLQKRNGYASLPSLPDNTSIYLSAFNDNLVAVGTRINALNSSSGTWIDKGSFRPVNLDTMSLVRSNANQIQTDSATAPNGLTCVAYTETVPVGRNPVNVSRYSIVDSVTGQNITPPTDIPVTSGTVTGPRVFVLGSNFIIVFTNTITGTPHLQYISISTVDPTLVSANVNISSSYTAAFTTSFDGYVVNNSLYLAWNGADVGGAIRVTKMTSSLVISTAVVFAGIKAEIASVGADITTSTPVIYISGYDTVSQNGYILAVNPNLSTVLAPTLWTAGVALVGTTIVAQNSVATIVFEVQNYYSYAPTVRTDYVRYRTCTQAGVLGTATTFLRSVGLSSKAFIINETIYVLAEYVNQGSTQIYQPTYFLTDTNGNICAKLAYQNGSQFYTSAWSSVTTDGNIAQISYLFKTLIQAVNKSTNVPSGTQTDGIYSQLGINLVKFDITTSLVSSAEIGGDLNFSGGLLWSYDGLVATENGFNVYPDDIFVTGDVEVANMTPQKYFYQVTYEWTDNQGNAFKSAPSIPYEYEIFTPPANFTGNRTSGSPIINSIASTANLQAGQAISGTGIPASTFILSVDSNTQITMTNNATSGAGTATVITPTAVTSALIYVPTLRLTYKIASPVKIVIYRWSTAQQTYYQVTSLVTPVFNDPTVDSVYWSDRLSDSQILGNNILYTTGGVLENIGPPASIAATLFDNRLWIIDAEDQNLLWYSKQVIESVPVEMSDLLTVFVAPTIGAQGSTGRCKCIFPMDDKIIIFKSDAIYYINGSGPDNTGENSQYSQPIFITSTVGCDNQLSIVNTPNGLMFQSGKGIWLLDRNLQTTYIGAPAQEFNNKRVTRALAIPGTNQVRFTISDGTTILYDYYYNRWGTFTNVPAISATIYKGLHTYINSYGEAFQESPGKYLDGANPVLIAFATGWLNMSGLQGYERAFRFFLLGKYLTPHKLNTAIAYDYNESPTQSTLISPDNFSPNYGNTSPYGQNSYGGNSNVENWRVNLARQRCSAFKLFINEIYDPSFGVLAGEGLTLSGINLIVGMKKGYRTISAKNTAGGGVNSG